MFHRKKLLPDVPIYIMMGGVGENFGGVTNVALHRSSEFSEIDGRPIGFLTTSTMHACGPGERERELKTQGRLAQGVYFRNAWHDLATMSDVDLTNLSSGISKSLSRDGLQLLPYCGESETQRLDHNGQVLQIDRFRADGTRYVSDRRDLRTRGSLGGREVTAFTRDGSVAIQWPGVRFVYHAWLDWLTAGELSVIIVDSANSGNIMHEFRRSHLLIVHALHSSHVYGRTKTGRAILAQNQRDRYMNLDNFDIVTTLTERQRRDLTADGIAGSNVVAVPNMTASNTDQHPSTRRINHGTVLSRLTSDKRINQMVSAIKTTSSSATLDIYGHGVCKTQIRDVITAENLDNRVRLCGYDPAARERFAEASFTLLTSRAEGQSLVLVEAMATGCIPISYDINYGPSDIITNGVDGFLVPEGDIEKLAAAIDRISTMSPKRVAAMRTAAMKTARNYQPKAITRKWGAILKKGLKSKQPYSSADGRAAVESAELNRGTLKIAIAIEGAAADADDVKLMFMQRKGAGYGRFALDYTHKNGHLYAQAILNTEEISSYGEGIVDFYADVLVKGNPARLRLKGLHLDFHQAEDTVEIYATKYGSLSMRVNNTEQSKDAETSPALG